MGVFSKMDEGEIKKRQMEQDARQADMDRREADLEHRAALIEENEKRNAEERRRFAHEQQAAEASLVEKNRELFASEQALVLRESEAKAGFVEQQREAFRDAVEKRLQQLDARQNELDAMQERLAEQSQALTSEQGAIAAREMAVKEREQKADAGFADKVRGLLAAVEEREAACEMRERTVREREAELLQTHKQLEQRAEELRKREELVSTAEQERDEGFTEQRRRLDMELHARRQKEEEELNQLRSQRLAEMDEELAEERRQRRDALSQELDADRQRTAAAVAAERKAFEDECARAADAQKKAQEEANERQASLEAKASELDYLERSLKAQRTALEERKLRQDDDVEQLVAERKAEFEADVERLNAQCSRLLERIQRSDKVFAQFDELKRRLGNREPEDVLAELDAKETALLELREKAGETSPALREEILALQAESNQLQEQLEEKGETLRDLQKRMRGEDELRAQLQTAEDQRRSLSTSNEILEGRCNQLTEENKRLRSAYEREEDREARIRDIETPHFDKVRPPSKKPDAEVDEIQWLDGVGRACLDYGLRFHPRILRSFHTALKTAEWSPLTILAGVSGTGKSELPRLYAHFGGMPFLSLAVQPNWDSQESMLGFFNSIDNKFDAQPVLRFLAQSQKAWSDDYPGLEDAICMILLDEMNLAHAELYFADFLSKLEYRRGLKGRDVPKLDVKLGAGIPPLRLDMGRNVLWTGTMNQDETTKSLSDKVLDRSIVIHFPRPATLERRKVLKALPEATALLPRRTWESWWARDSQFSDEEVRPFKTFVEDINDALSEVGRALGHRVWQSVEYYMANYPEVRAARKGGDHTSLRQGMRDAFEDQLVQKIMPKLRGIETRGRSKTECLDKVRALLVENEYDIVDDFELSCEFGYGQFIWQSANFLRDAGSSADSAPSSAPDMNPDMVAATPRADEPEDGLDPTSEHAQPTTAETAAEPPPNFMPGKPERTEEWAKLSGRKQKIWLQSNQRNGRG